MKFNSRNEIETFSFNDAEITGYSCDNTCVEFKLEALIVEPSNSQNTNFTKSYADSTVLRLDSGEILSGFKEGYSYYDANDTLIEKVDDKEMSIDEITNLLKDSKGAYLFDVKKCEEGYVFGIEFVGEDQFDPSEDDTYYVTFKGKDISVSWDKYLNRVQG